MKSPELIGEETAKAVQETAKATGKVVDLLGKLGDSAAGRATSTAVAEAVGILGDWARTKREKYAAEVVKLTRDTLERRGRPLPSPDDDVPLTIVEPLLEAASGESRAELQDVWARLLAAAVDPNRAGQVRASLVEAMKLLEPLDCPILIRLNEKLPQPPTSIVSDLAGQLNTTSEDVEESFHNLHKAGLVDFTPIQMTSRGRPKVTSKGKLFLRAVSD